MASNDVEIVPGDSKTACGEPFNFDQWIETNELAPVKSLMIKHNLNTIDSLSLTSPQYVQLLSDPDLFQTKLNFISKIHKAIQSFNDTTHSQISQSLDDFIVISEAERSVMDKLKHHIVELDEIEKHMKQLKAKYPESIQRINKERDSQIEQAQKKINDTFDNIKNELNKRQQHLLDELIKMKEGNINVDDMKEIQLFDEVENAVKIQRNKINENLKLCNDTVIKQKNKDRDKRKEFILNVGEECDKEFNLQMQNMKKSEQRVQELITKNNEYCIKIAFNINDGKYNNLLKTANNLGAIDNSEQPSEDNDEAKEIKEQIFDYSAGFAITDDHDSSEDTDEKSNCLKDEKLKQEKQKCSDLTQGMEQKIKELYDTINQWQQKYDKLINGLDSDTTNKWQLYKNRCSNLMNSIESCKQKYKNVVEKFKTLEQKCNNLAAANMDVQNQYNNLQDTICHQATETLKLQRKYDDMKESHKRQVNEAIKWQQKYNDLKGLHEQTTKNLQQKYNNATIKWQTTYSSIVKSLGFSHLSDFRWCKEEKEQYVPVKIIGRFPIRYVSIIGKGSERYVSKQGLLKTADEVLQAMPNTTDPQQISKWVSLMKKTYERVTQSKHWTFDCWDSNLKHDHILLWSHSHVVRTASNLYWFRSVFTSKICKSPFKYHWELEQQTESPRDFYVGIERVGKETVDTYFCKSSTSYGFSGHDAKLYSNGTSGDDYGKCCSKKGDTIDVYLDLEKNELSYGINFKNFGKAYDVKPGQYRLAISMNGISKIKMVYSTIQQ